MPNIDYKFSWYNSEGIGLVRMYQGNYVLSAGKNMYVRTLMLSSANFTIPFQDVSALKTYFNSELLKLSAFGNPITSQL